MKQSIVRRIATEATKVKPAISIPYAIKRAPTDLLKALNSTVGVDTTAPHFAFIDDPTTIPTTASQKKTYFLAKELGKRAARQLAEEWPTLFMFDRDYPRLPAFRPEKALDPIEVEPNVENLNKFIQGKEVTSAIRLYERMQSGNIEVPLTTQKELFQLVAYYNAEDVPIDEIEEWHGLRNFMISGSLKWQEAGIAELLFEGLEKTAENYSTMIAALCKHPTDVSVVKAKSLFHEMISKKLVPTEEAFNALIMVSDLKDIPNLLQTMNNLKVAPSVRTFNAYLMAVTKLKEFSQQWKLIRQILGEMKAINVLPSLSTYSIVLETIYPAASENEANELSAEQLQIGVNVLEEILIKLEGGGAMGIVDSTDQYFFLNALRIAFNAKNEALLDRIEKLYVIRKNDVAMTALTTETIFYSKYLLFKASSLPLEALEKLYKELVPRVVGTTSQLTMHINERLTQEFKWSFCKRVIEDSIASRYMRDPKMAASVLKLLLAQNPFEMSAQEKEEFQAEAIRVVDIILELAHMTKVRWLQIKLTPNKASECALLLIKAGHYDRAWEIIELLLDEKNKHGDDAIVASSGYATPDVLLQLFNAALERDDWYNASHCLQLMSFYQDKPNLGPLVAKIEVKCTLTPIQRRMLQNFVRLSQ